MKVGENENSFPLLNHKNVVYNSAKFMVISVFPLPYQKSPQNNKNSVISILDYPVLMNPLILHIPFHRLDERNMLLDLRSL